MSEKSYKYYVPIKFRETKKVYYFGSNDHTITANTAVVVETIRGVELGETAGPASDIESIKIDNELKPVIRVATKQDLRTYEKNKEYAQSAKAICENLIRKLDLEMNLISAEYTLDRNKILFVYVSETRVDFRELLKELATSLKCRIELRQVGPRDKAKIVGSIGMCGMETCCSRYKEDFEVISINMAKNQMMALNIQKLSGQCGKLMCCLAYENENYKLLRKGTPKLNSQIKFQGKRYKVTSINIMQQEARIENDTEVLVIPFEQAFEDYRKGQHEKTKELR